MKHLYQRWLALIMVATIASGVFNLTDWEFWLVVLLNGTAWGSLFKN
jgi:hypothetical protein